MSKKYIFYIIFLVFARNIAFAQVPNASENKQQAAAPIQGSSNQSKEKPKTGSSLKKKVIIGISIVGGAAALKAALNDGPAKFDKPLPFTGKYKPIKWHKDEISRIKKTIWFEVVTKAWQECSDLLHCRRHCTDTDILRFPMLYTALQNHLATLSAGSASDIIVLGAGGMGSPQIFELLGTLSGVPHRLIVIDRDASVLSQLTHSIYGETKRAMARDRIVPARMFIINPVQEREEYIRNRSTDIQRHFFKLVDTIPHELPRSMSVINANFEDIRMNPQSVRAIIATHSLYYAIWHNRQLTLPLLKNYLNALIIGGAIYMDGRLALLIAQQFIDHKLTSALNIGGRFIIDGSHFELAEIPTIDDVPGLDYSEPDYGYLFVVKRLS